MILGHLHLPKNIALLSLYARQQRINAPIAEKKALLRSCTTTNCESKTQSPPGIFRDIRMAALHSDHINYLILRYLQEHGHESAATAFYRDWHRPQEFRDPENLPFAPVVKRHALVSVVQDGLRFDELSARSSKYGRKFRWTAINPRQPLDEQEDVEAALEDGTATESRPPSSGKRKGRPPVMRAPDEFPTPAPKRQRRSEGSEGLLLNGDRDAMDVDAISPTAEVDEDAEAVSPNVASDTEVIEVPERYDSMDVATQTDIKTGPKTSAMYWTIDKPGARVLHNLWNPDPNPKNAKTLLTVGESLCRFYEIPDAMDDAKQISHNDDPKLAADSVVTATAWHPNGHTAASAVDGTRHFSGDRSGISQRIVLHSRDYGSVTLDARAKLLEPASIVLCLRYSPKGDYLLVLRTNLHRGLVQVWRTPGSDEHKDNDSDLQAQGARPIAWRIFERQVLDASWTADDRFLVCGDDGISGAYNLDQTIKPENGFTEESVAVHGLVEHQSEMIGLRCKWDKLRVDGRLGVAAFASTERRVIFTVPLQSCMSDTADKGDIGDATSLPGQLTALAFQPHYDSHENQAGDHGAEDSCLLAATFEEGLCVLYRISRPSSTHADCEELLQLELPEGPALALAWSPQGTHLAIGNTDLAQVWQAEDLERLPNGKRHEALVTWQPDADAIGKRNGEHADEQEGMIEPSLSWSADGESLAFAVDRQVSIAVALPKNPATGANICV